MRFAWIPVVMVAALAAVFVSKSLAEKKPPTGQAAPAFTLTDQDGKSVSLSDFKGKIVVLEWFNNECPYVKKFYTGGDMNKWASAYGEKGVVWIAINSTNGKTPESNKKVAGEWKMDRLILDDSAGNVGHLYGATNTPNMYIVDKEGNLAYQGAIDNKPSPKQEDIAGATNYVAQALDELLAGKPVSTPETKPYGCGVKYGK